jgi:multiple sugar transport system permease protein
MKTKHQTLWIILFLTPSLIGLLFFVVIPIIASLGLTLFQWNLLNDPIFIGLQNFKELFSDHKFWAAFRHTLYFIVGYIPLVMICSIAVALVLNQKLIGRKLLRTAFYIPVVSAWVAVALLWTWIFNPKYGLINFLLGFIGVTGPAWLYDPQWAMIAIIITSVWKDTGFFMLMFLSGLQNIPSSYYEAAEIDGANSAQKFWYITFPLLTPTTFFAITMALINSFQVFDQISIMTDGGPAGATTVVVQQIVSNAFEYSRMGYASTISWVLFIFVFIATLLQMRVQSRWVNY